MPTIDLCDLQARCFQTAEERGHHDNLRALDPRLQMLARLALVHTEISEAQECVFEAVALDTPLLIEECSDIAIRLMELCWCAGLPLQIAPECVEQPINAQALFRRLGQLHMLVSRITQSVKRHGVTQEVGMLTANALEVCWDIAYRLGADLLEAIEKKDAYNRTRAYGYGTPREVRA